MKELFLHEGDGILRRRLFGGRMLNYYLYLVNQHQQHIVQTVLYVGRESLRMEPAYTTASLEFRFEIVNLREFDAEPLLASDDWADIVLALLAKGDTEKVIAAAIPRLRRMTGETRAWASGTMILLSGIMNLEEFVSQRLKEAGMINVLENKVIGPLILQAEEKGRTEGLQQGLQGLQRLLAGQLTEKFGPLPAWAATRLQSASTAELELWASRILQARTLEDTFV